MKPAELSGTRMPESHRTTQAVMEEGLMPLSGKINHNVTFPKGTAQRPGWLLQIFVSEFLLACKAHVPAMRNVLWRALNMTGSSKFSTHLECI